MIRRWSMRIVAAVTLLALGTSIAGCPARSSTPWGANLAPAERDVLLQWLLCDDCQASARVNAVAIGDRAVAALGDALAGPPEQWRRDRRVRLERSAARIGRSGADATEMVNANLERFDANIQQRSAIALGDIATPGALQRLRGAIDSADARNYREDVVRALHEALLSASGQPFAGSLSDSTPDFLDTVVVFPPPAAGWNADEDVVLNGAPFPDSLRVWRRGSDSLAFVAAGRAGRYALSILRSPGADTQYVPIVIRSFPARPDSTLRSLSIDSLPVTILRSLARTATIVDTLHAYRLHAAIPTTVRATAEWHGPARLELRWSECRGLSVVGPSRTIGGTVVDESGAPMVGAQVQLAGSTLAAATGTDGAFLLTGVPPGHAGPLQIARIGYQPAREAVAEGRTGYWIVMNPSGPLPPLATAQSSTEASPHVSSHAIPAGGCRVLSVVKRDVEVPTVIARLRLERP